MTVASVWFSSLILTPSLASTAWCKTLTPASPFKDAAGELVDDLHLTLLDDVVLVAAVKLFRPQRRLEVVHEIGGDLVVKVLDAELPLDFVHTFFGWRHAALFFVDVVVHVTLQSAGDAGKLVVQFRSFARRGR